MIKTKLWRNILHYLVKIMKNQILFIGSFILPKNGHYGGVYFASTSLRDKMKNEGIEVIELDTTLKDISVTKVSKRIPTIIARNFRFLYKILFSPQTKILFVFVSAGNSYLDKLASIVLARLLQKKIILFPRSGHLMTDFEKPFYKFFIRKALNNVSSIICQSGYWRDYFISKEIDKNKLKVIENWIPDEIILKSKELNYPNYDFNSKEIFQMVFVSRIEVAKGINDLIEVAKSLPKRLKIKIDVYGEGSYKDEFLSLIKKEQLGGVISYKGWLGKSKMQEVLNNYHLALFTSRVEGYPNSLHDFIFSKTPILAYNIPAVKAVGGECIMYYQDTGTMVKNILYSVRNYTEISSKAGELYEQKVNNNNIDFAFKELMKI